MSAQPASRASERRKACAWLLLFTTGCLNASYSAPRSLFAPDANVEALCSEYSPEAMGKDITDKYLRGWRVMTIGTMTYTFGSTAVVVCYERIVSSKAAAQ